MESESCDKPTLFNAILKRKDIVDITPLEIEYAPANRADYLGDMTRVDLVCEAFTADSRFLVVFETKYIDRFSQRRVAIDAEKYDQTWQTFQRVFADQSLQLHSDNPCQLFRIHSLAAAIGSKRRGGLQVEVPYLVALVHPADENAKVACRAYGETLIDQSRVVTFDHKVFFAHLMDAKPNETDNSHLKMFSVRYLEEELSEQCWQWFSSNR